MKRLLLAISVLLVLGLAGAAIAYTRSSVSAETAMSCCCCSGDSCPMKKDSASKDAASCCKDGCCKDGSCSMKHGAGAAENMPADCPMMKKKDGQAAAASMEMSSEHGDSCCCSCCKKSDA